MFILQNIKDFIDNPMGKGSTAITNRQLIKDDLNKRYKKILKTKKIDLNIYKDNDEYYFHFKIPSESERNNTYDVVLNFVMDDEDFKFDNFLNRYYLKFFSNCPSFIFTYAYAFNLYGMFIEHLENKYDKKVLEDDPVIRNPGEIINYEKSIYFACTYIMENKKYLNKMILNTIAKPFNKNEFNKLIRNYDTISLEIKKEDNKVKEEKEKKENEIKEHNKKALNELLNNRHKILPNTGITIIKPSKKIRARKSSVSKIKPK